MSHPLSLTFRLANSLSYELQDTCQEVCLDSWDVEGQSHSVQVRTRLQCETGSSPDGQPGAVLGCKVRFLNQKSSVSERCLCIPTPRMILALTNLSTWSLMFISLLGVTFMIIFPHKPFLLLAVSLSPRQALDLPVCVGQLKFLSVSCLLTFTLECYDSQTTAPVI